MVEIKSGLLSDCQREFQTKDLYAILNLDKTATQADIKKAYYKFSLKYHPDKVAGSDQNDATLKFQIIGKVYSILSDEEKRKIYDECGVIDGEDDLFSSVTDWDKYFRQIFKKITKDDIKEFFAKYRESEDEKQDLFKAYIKHKGDMDKILTDVLSEDVLADEARFRDLISKGIEAEDLEDYEAFKHESATKAKKRKAKYEKEAKEAEVMRKERGIDDTQDSLVNAILANKKKGTFDSMINNLESKYCAPKAKTAATTKATTKAKGGAVKKTKRLTRASAKRTKGRAANDEDDEDEDDETLESESEEEEEVKPKKTRSSVRK